jgi:cell division protein FtsW
MFKRAFSIKSGHRPDYVILVVALFLLLVGFLALASASSDIGKIRFNNTLYYVWQQVIKGLIPGLIGFIAGYFIYYRKLKKLTLFLFLLNIVLLFLVFVPGIGLEINGSRRWIEFGLFSFQPSEFLKITFILYIASLFSGQRIKELSGKGGWRTYGIFLLVSAIVGVLIFFQPATTMAVIIVVSGMVVYFLSGKSVKQLTAQIVVSVGAAILVLAVLAVATPYRMARVIPFWNVLAEKYFPSVVVKSASTDSFHLNQALMAIGTGGLTGVGFGKSTSKYSILPEPMGDSIFAVIAEEFGFIGSLILIILYLVLFWRSIKIASKSNDEFARLAVTGFVSVLAIQAIIHIGANTGILPYTGVPLPFISYGGTSLAVTLTMMGIMANISKHSTLL